MELKQGNGEALHVIPIYVHGDRAWISLLRTGLSMEELNALFSFVLKDTEKINRLSFKITEMNPAVIWKEVIERKSNAWFLELEENYNRVLQRASAKTRYDIRYNRRCLEKTLGGIYIETFNKKHLPKDVIEKYLLLKRQYYNIPNSENTAEKLLNNPKLDITNVYVLKSIDGKELAIQLNSEHGTVACLVNMAYDLKYKEMSPGRLLYVETIGLLIEKGFRTLYLGSGESWYKRLFGSLKTDYWVGDAFRDEKYRELAKKNEKT